MKVNIYSSIYGNHNATAAHTLPYVDGQFLGSLSYIEIQMKFPIEIIDSNDLITLTWADSACSQSSELSV